MTILGFCADRWPSNRKNRWPYSNVPPSHRATTRSPPSATAPRRKPLMQDAFKPVRAVEGCPARIEGRVSGHPPPTVTWFKDGKPLDASDHARPYLLPDGTFGLAFDRCLPEDSGAGQEKFTALPEN